MKKGQYEGFEIIFSVILLVILIFIASFLFLANRSELAEERLNQIRLSENNLLLLNYLRTPVDYNNEKILMGDLIVLRDKDKIEEETWNIFDNYYSKEFMWEININYDNDNIIMGNIVRDIEGNPLSEFNLTGFDGNISITLETWRKDE